MSKRFRKLLALCLVVAVVLTQLILTQAASAATTGNRLYGSDRYQTAIDIAKQMDSANTAVLAYGEDFPDALAAAPLAKKYDAPILLTDKNQLTAGVLDELNSLGVKTVYIVGGTGVVSQAVQDTLTAAGMTVDRLAGADRYATALAVANQLGTTDTVVVASGENYPDALSVAPIAAEEGWPILLTDTNTMDPAVKAYIGDKKVYVIGGTGAVSDAAVAGLNDERVYGADRYATNVAVLTKFDADLNYNNVYLATGEDFPDALAGSALAASMGAPIVLVGGSTVGTTYAAGKVTANSNVTAFGGTAVVSSAALSAVAPVTPPTPATFQVQSVSELNAKQIKVIFSQPVDKTSAGNKANYVVTDSTGTPVALMTGHEVVVASDYMSATLNLQNAMTKDTSYSFDIKNITAKGDMTKSIPEFFQVVLMPKDVTAPTVTEIDSSTNNTTASEVDVYFSEPVVAATFKVDGQYVGASWNYKNTEAMLKNLSIPATGSHTLEVINATDYNSNVTTDVSQSFTVSTDTAAPTVTLSAKSDSQIYLTFNKDMDTTTVNKTNITVSNELLATLGVDSIVPDPNDTTGDTVFIATLSAASAGSLYTTTNTRTLTVSFNGNIQDSLGNYMPISSQAITMTKDATAPVITNVNYLKSGSNVTDIVVTLSKGLAAGSYASSNITVIGSDGKAAGFLLATTSNAVTAGATQVDFPIVDSKGAPAPQPISGVYTFAFKSGAFTDVSVNGNTTASTSINVDFGASSGTFTLPAANVGVASNIITVTYPGTVIGGVQTGSATDVTNYTVNGTALSGGTAILDSTGKIVTLTLPHGVVSANGNVTFGINNVQETNGATIVPFATTVFLTDNTSLTATSAKYNANNQVVVNLNKYIATGSSTANSIYIVKSDGTTLDPATDQGTVTFQVNPDDNTVSQAVINFSALNSKDLTGASIVLPKNALKDDNNNGISNTVLALADGYVANVGAITMGADDNIAGVTGADFTITATNVAEPNVNYSVYVVPSANNVTITKYNYTNYTALLTGDSNSTDASYLNFAAVGGVTLGAAVTTDSLGNAFANTSTQYSVFVVAKDKAGNINISSSTVTPDPTK